MGPGNVRKWRRPDAVAVVGLIGWRALDLTARILFGAVPWPQSVVDYRIFYNTSRHVVATQQCPTTSPYPYPPPAVAVHAASAATPFAIDFGVCGLWVAVGLAGAAASWENRSRDGVTVLAHVSLLVLDPVAVNPYLEPHPLVALVVPAVLLLAAVADTRRATRVRAVAALGLGILKVSCPWPLRGLLVNAQALVRCGTAVWVVSVGVVNAAPEGTTIITASVRPGRVASVLATPPQPKWRQRTITLRLVGPRGRNDR